MNQLSNNIIFTLKSLIPTQGDFEVLSSYFSVCLVNDRVVDGVISNLGTGKLIQS